MYERSSHCLPSIFTVNICYFTVNICGNECVNICKNFNRLAITVFSSSQTDGQTDRQQALSYRVSQPNGKKRNPYYPLVQNPKKYLYRFCSICTKLLSSTSSYTLLVYEDKSEKHYFKMTYLNSFNVSVCVWYLLVTFTTSDLISSEFRFSMKMSTTRVKSYGVIITAYIELSNNYF